MASDAEEGNVDGGAQFGESFAPVVNALESAYNAWMRADKQYNDYVNEKDV